MKMNQEIRMNQSGHDLQADIEKRKRSVKVLNILSIIVYFGMLVIPLADICLFHTDSFAVSLLGVMCLPGGYFLGRVAKRKNEELKEVVGQCIVQDILAEQVQVLEYMPNGYMNKDFIKGCRVLPKFDVLHGAEYIHGIYKGADFTLCNLQLISEYRGTEAEPEVKFEGPFMLMKLRQTIHGCVDIKEYKWSRNPQNALLTGNAAFDDRFGVNASDEQLVASILTPGMIDSIMRLESYVNIEFCGNMLVIALNNGKNLFELEEKKEQKGVEQYRQDFRNDLSGILRILDCMMENGWGI